jgi:hypothetical protein
MNKKLLLSLGALAYLASRQRGRRNSRIHIRDHVRAMIDDVRERLEAGEDVSDRDIRRLVNETGTNHEWDRVAYLLSEHMDPKKVLRIAPGLKKKLLMGTDKTVQKYLG